MSHAMILAFNTFREAVRDRLIAAVLTFGILFVAGSVILAPLTLGEQERIIRDLGLTAISLFAILMIVVVGTGMVYREIERRTIYTILTHPVSRPAFILGKFLGLYGTVLVSIVLLSIVYLLVVGFFAGGVEGGLLLALVLTALEAFVVTSIAILFSSIASPLLSAVFTFVLYVVGHMARDVTLLAQASGNVVLEKMSGALYVILPSLHHFDIRNHVLSGQPVPIDQVVYCFQYSMLYSAAVLLVTVVVFRTRDFE